MYKYVDVVTRINKMFADNGIGTDFATAKRYSHLEYVKSSHNEMLEHLYLMNRDVLLQMIGNRNMVFSLKYRNYPKIKMNQTILKILQK